MIRHTTISVIESDRARIAHLERWLDEREDVISLQADEIALLAVNCAELRRENAALRRPSLGLPPMEHKRFLP